MCNLPGFGGGGATSEEQGLAADSTALGRSLAANYRQTFGQQQDALTRLNAEIGRIQSGQTGPGFSAEELAAKTSQIENQAAAGERNAQQAVQNQSAGQQFAGASDASGLARTSAIRQQINAEIASGGEINKANALENLTGANFEQGRRNAAATVSGLDTLAGRYNPLGYASEAGNINKQSFEQAKTIRQQEMEKGSLLGGLLKTGLSLGTTFATGGMAGLAGTGGESFFQKTGDFFKGGIDALGSQG